MGQDRVASKLAPSEYSSGALGSYTRAPCPFPTVRPGTIKLTVSGGVFGFTVKVFFFGGVVPENQAGAVELYRRASGRRSGVPDTDPASNDA